MPDQDQIQTVVVGYGLAGRVFHVPLIKRQPELALHGLVIRDESQRQQTTSDLALKGYPSLDEALRDPAVDLVVIATPHNTHADLVLRTLEAGKHCVVDKVMALNEADCHRMLAARDASSRMLSVFQNRRWDFDYQLVHKVLKNGWVGTPLVIESSVCRYAAPRAWRGDRDTAGTILHDWGAHLIDQALNLGLGPIQRVTAWLTPAPWETANNGAHGRILLEFKSLTYHIEISRVCAVERPRWLILGATRTFEKHGLDPQEEALRRGDLDSATEPPEHAGFLHTPAAAPGGPKRSRTTHQPQSWDAYYANIAAHLLRQEPLAVTAESAAEVVKVLDAAHHSIDRHATIDGLWGTTDHSNAHTAPAS